MLMRSIQHVAVGEEMSTPDIEVLRHVLPLDVLQAAHRYVAEQAEDEVSNQLTNGSDIPSALAEILLHTQPLSGRAQVITRRVNSNEQPDGFTIRREATSPNDNRPLVICALGGSSLLSVRTSSRRLLEISSEPNTIIVSRTNQDHRIKQNIFHGVGTFLVASAASIELNALPRIGETNPSRSMEEPAVEQRTKLGVLKADTGKASFVASLRSADELFLPGISGNLVTVNQMGRSINNPELIALELQAIDPRTNEELSYRGHARGSIGEGNAFEFIREHKKGEVAAALSVVAIGVTVGSLYRHHSK
jgi:hypothetical protein